MTDVFDLIVIGAGPGGYVAAIRAAQLGLKTAVIERENLGGICLNWGCIPTKAMLRAAEVYHTIQHSEEFGIKCGNVSIDFQKLIDRSRKIAGQLADGINHLLHKNKIKHISGSASFLSNKLLEVKDASGKVTEVSAKNIVIATGARSKVLPHLEIDGKLVWGYKEAMTQKKLPKSILVVGSGAIGVEFASFYNMLGTDVHIIEVAERILMAEDQEIATLAHAAFQKRGIKISTNSKITNIVRHKDHISIEWKSDDKVLKKDFEHVISAVGVQANVENLGLEKTKIQLERGYIKTGKYMETDEPNVYAIGDVTAPPLLAHKASHEGIICAEHIAGLAPEHMDRNKIPGCTYCYPQIASLGYTEQQARDLKLDVKIGKFPMIANGKALAVGETGGIVKVIFDAKTGELLGCHMIGHEVTEMIHSIGLVKVLEGTEEDIIHNIFPHPTISEAMYEAVLSAYGRAIHI